MELWIRSQNKEIFMKCDDIAIDENRIVGYFNKDTEYEELGIYETKERALEVVDEIHNLDIENNPNIKVNCYAYTIINLVYQMPKE